MIFLQAANSICLLKIIRNFSIVLVFPIVKAEKPLFLDHRPIIRSSPRSS